MNTHAAASLSISLSIVALLASCGPGSGPNGPTAVPASILSVSPGEIDVTSDEELDPVHVSVRTSADPRDVGQAVCATSTGAAFSVVHVGIRFPDVVPGPVDPTAWEVTFEPDPDLSVEEHTGFLEIFLSSDPQCEVRGGSVSQIPYRISKVHGLAQPASVTLHVGPDTTADELHGTARIDMAAGPQHGWTASSQAPWLVLETPDGVTGGDVRFHVDPAGMRSLFAHRRSATGEIRIAGDTAGMTARTVRVTVQLAVPLAPLETPRAVLPGSGADGQLLWDGARSTLLALEPPPAGGFQYSTTLRRHAFRDGLWTTAAKGVDRVRRIGLSPDGKKLLATSDSDYALLAMDPEHLGRVGLYGAPLQAPFEPRSRAPLAVTFDSVAWVGVSNALMTYETAATYRIRVVSLSLWYAPDGRSPQTIASRDGSRLLVSRPGTRAFLYHDATEPLRADAFHANPAGAVTFDAISDDGGRVLSGVNVYDGDFALLGTLPAPAILSGDGRRAFTLEQRSDWRAGGPAPLVHVFDVTAPVEEGGALPELGTVDLLDHDTCAAGERVCASTTSLAVTPDGRVLFAQTAGGVVVVPIPESLTAP